MQTPVITATPDEVIIRTPRPGRRMARRIIRTTVQQRSMRRPTVDWESFIGVLADVPEFKGKTSVEVQHMLRDLWVKKYTS